MQIHKKNSERTELAGLPWHGVMDASMVIFLKCVYRVVGQTLILEPDAQADSLEKTRDSLVATPGDWLIKDEEGVISVCPAEIFWEKYDEQQ